MTRWLMLSVCLLALVIPARGLAGNAKPELYLEVYAFENKLDTIPAQICTHPLTSPLVIPCYAARRSHHYYYMPVHFDKLDLPTCANPGPDCADQGGYLGLGFGVKQTPRTGTPLVFISWNACPGFVKGPSNNGEPVACLASSSEKCHGSEDHLGYLVYFSDDTTSAAAHFDITPSADTGDWKVVNCSSLFDEGTVIGGGVQVGGKPTVTCKGEPVKKPVKEKRSKAKSKATCK